MAKHAPSAEATSISSYFVGTCSRNPADSTPVVLSASVLADSMKTSVEYSGCKRTSSLAHAKGRQDARSLLPNPIQKLRRAHKKQKRTTLHMLATSDAVNPAMLNSVTRHPSSALSPSARDQRRSGISKPNRSHCRHEATTPHSK
jgi:type IV secretory pathway VirB4 component